MGTKMAVAFANIFMAKIEKEILRQSSIKPIFWKRFIDDVISVWDTSRNEIEEFLLKANNFHPTIKFTAEISETETTFLDTKVYKGVRFKKDSILDVRTHFKPTETFEYTNFSSCHPPSLPADVFWSVTNEPQRKSAGRLVTHQALHKASSKEKL